MISLASIFTILVIHWIADFVFQTDWQAQNKSKNNIALLTHTINYSVCWAIPIIFLLPGDWTTRDYLIASVQFTLVTFICHTITDYFTSRLNTYLYNKKQIHYFFVSIGFDQILHYVQLFLTYYYIINK